MWNRCTLTIILAFGLFFAANGQDISARWIERNLPDSLNTHLFLQDVTLEISTIPDVQVLWPKWKDSLGNFEILNAGKIDTLNSSTSSQFRQNLTLIALDSGFYQVPNLQISYVKGGDTLQTYSSTLAYEVNTSQINPEEEIRAIKDIIGEPLTWRDYILWVGIGVLLAGLVLGLILYLQRRKKGEPIQIRPKTIPVPANETALRKLSQLEEKKLWQKGQIKEFYSELTEIIRFYIEETYKIPAMESISDDIMKDLTNKPLSTKLNEGLKQMLMEADLAKFAKYKPQSQTNMLHMDFARKFIRESWQQKKAAEKAEQDHEKETLTEKA